MTDLGLALSWCEQIQQAGEALGVRGWTRGVREAERSSFDAAQQFVKYGTGYATWKPGNLTTYPVVLHDLERPQLEALAGRQFGDRSRWRDVDNPNRLGPAFRWGGRLMVSVPGLFGGGRCAAMALLEFYDPQFVAEQFCINSGDAFPLAIGLTMFGACVVSEETARCG